ncbi:hypothetical protein EDB82DRAFT_285889 [Fusarium venenatum]|uniref:uncharacterized protein n=1 Tax=Fusarium venenatum TaxID=56646 RepID=UPI001D8BBB15|nr:hypothetical protein EDB82DRAFT_285889 [Fusarium venenatum]
MSFNKEIEHDLLLSGEEEMSSDEIDAHSLVEKYSFPPPSKVLCRLRQFPWQAIVIHTGILVIYSAVLFFIVVPVWTSYQTGSEVAYTPFNPGLQAQVFQHKHSVYVGKPSYELDKAWRKVLKNSNIRITEEEIMQFPGLKEQAIELPDRGYFATPNVYHNLHCIKRLHHYMYPEYYFANITQEQKVANEYHNCHCLDMLRHSVMCQGDM